MDHLTSSLTWCYLPVIAEPYPNPQQRLCLAPFPLSRFGLLTSCCVCPLLSLGAQGQAYTDEGQEPNQSSPERQSSGAKGPKATLFQGVTVSQLRAVPVHPVCAARWRTAGLVPPGKIPVHSLSSGQEVVMIRRVTPAESSPCWHTKAAVPRQGYLRGSHSHWLLGLLCSSWGVLTLQELTTEGSERTGSQALLLHQCRGISADVMSVPHVEGKTGPLLQGCSCTQERWAESCWEDRNVCQGTQSGLSTDSVQQLCSFSASSVLTQGHGYRTQMCRKGFS